MNKLKSTETKIPSLTESIVEIIIDPLSMRIRALSHNYKNNFKDFSA